MGQNAINFKVYPTNNRVPGVFAEVDPSLANTGQQIQRALIIGQITSSGTYVAGTPIIASGVGDAQTGAGNGSMLALMYAQYRQEDVFGEVWLLPLADDGSAVAASETITVTGPATAAGSIALYIGACPPVVPRITAAVANGDTQNTIAAAINTAINAQPLLPVTSTVTTNVVTVTAKNKGLAGNDIDIRANVLGALGGESTPAGVTLTFSNPVASGSLLTGGTVNPSLTTPLANIAGDQTFDFICMPYSDTTSLTSIQSFLNDTTGRWSFSQELFGGAWTASRGTFAALGTFGTARNDQHTFAIGTYDSPSPPFLWAVDWMAVSAVSLRADPALPLQTLALKVLPPPLASRFTISQRNTLLFDGVSTFLTDDSQTVHIDRGITTYQKNSASAPDTSYLDIETMYQLQFIIRDYRQFLQSNYSRVKLVSDGTRITAGSNMATAQTILQSVIARYRVQANLGIVQNPDQFASQAVAQNAGSGLVKLLLPVQLANQLRQIAMLVQFTKP